jgi:hypothetical protein
LELNESLLVYSELMAVVFYGVSFRSRIRHQLADNESINASIARRGQGKAKKIVKVRIVITKDVMANPTPHILRELMKPLLLILITRRVPEYL